MGIVRITALEILKSREPIVYADLVEQVQKKTGNTYTWSNVIFKILTKEQGWTLNNATGKFQPPEIKEDPLVDISIVLKVPLSKVKEFFSTAL